VIKDNDRILSGVERLGMTKGKSAFIFFLFDGQSSCLENNFIVLIEKMAAPLTHDNSLTRQGHD
jgi:hypothetical protein